MSDYEFDGEAYDRWLESEWNKQWEQPDKGCSSRMDWKLIPKDKWGLFEAEDEEFYNDLPCVVYNEDDEYPCYEIIDKNNYGDWTHHLSKKQYKWYLPFPEKGGDE